MGLPRIVASGLIAVALALAACGDDERGTVEQSGGSTSTSATTPTETTPTATTGGEPVATIEVEETEYELNPANPGVESAGVVRFEVTNAGKIPHALEVDGPEGEVETEEIAPGETATIEADLGKAGKYRWYCPISDHAEQGMDGFVFIAGGGGDDGGSSGEDDSGGAAGY